MDIPRLSRRSSNGSGSCSSNAGSGDEGGKTDSRHARFASSAVMPKLPKVRVQEEGAGPVPLSTRTSAPIFSGGMAPSIDAGPCLPSPFSFLNQMVFPSSPSRPRGRIERGIAMGSMSTNTTISPRRSKGRLPSGSVHDHKMLSKKHSRSGGLPLQLGARSLASSGKPGNIDTAPSAPISAMSQSSIQTIQQVSTSGSWVLSSIQRS